MTVKRTCLMVMAEPTATSASASAPANMWSKLTCAEAVKSLVKDKRRWEVRSAGQGQGRAVVRLGVDRHRLAAAPPAGPVPPGNSIVLLPCLFTCEAGAVMVG
jgi:hypothetical protein